jgi:hypothetical protein
MSALHLLPSHGSERSVSPSPSSPSSSPSRLQSQQSLCPSWESGRCSRGSQCKYLHLGNFSAAPPLVTSNTFPSFPAQSSSASSSSSPSSSALLSSQLYNSLFSSSSASPVSSYSHSLAFELEELQLDGPASSMNSVSNSKYSQQQQQYPQYPQQHRQQYEGGRQQQQHHDYGSSSSTHGSGGGNGFNSLMMAGMGMQALGFGMMHAGGGYAHHNGSLGGVKKECWDWLAGRCTRGVMCKYAHANQQLSMQAARAAGGASGMAGLKLGQNDNVCHQWTRSGQCQYGDVCKFAHVTQQMPAAFASRQQHQLGASDYAADDEHPTYPAFSAAAPLSSAFASSSASAISSSSSQFLYTKESAPTSGSSSSSGSPPPLVFRDSRLGLDTEVCRFYAKHTRCKYSNACKFVHVHHGAVGGVQVSGVNVTIGELQRLCALHLPAAIVGMGAASLSSMGVMGSKSSSNGLLLGGGAGGGGQQQQQQLLSQTASAASAGADGQGSGGYEKEYGAFDRESREMKAVRELKAQQRRLGGLLVNGSGGSPTSSASAPSSASSSPQSFRDPLAIQTTKSTPTLGGGLNGSISPSLLQLSQQRQSTESKTIGSSGSSTGYMSPLTFPAPSPAAASSFRLSSAEAAGSASVSSFASASAASFQSARSVTRPALSFHQQSSSSDLTDFHLPLSSSSAAYLDDDAMLIAGSTYAALSGSGALADEADADTWCRRQDSSSSSHDGSSPLLCHHCAIKGSVYHDSYSNLCDDCYTALLR